MPRSTGTTSSSTSTGSCTRPTTATAFAADLKKSLPRIPQVDNAEDFWAFSNAGRELAHLHTEYEIGRALARSDIHLRRRLRPRPPRRLSGPQDEAPEGRGPARPQGPEGRGPRAGSSTTTGSQSARIPERAYDYELGSRSAIGWVMESNRVRTDKASGIRNDPNDWATRARRADVHPRPRRPSGERFDAHPRHRRVLATSQPVIGPSTMRISAPMRSPPRRREACDTQSWTARIRCARWLRPPHSFRPRCLPRF